MFDIGSHTFKAGYAGEDTPKVLLCCVLTLQGAFPSAVGVRSPDMQVKMDTGGEEDGPGL